MKHPGDQIRQGVILAAGRGSRIFPLSDGFPKVLLPIFNKPILEYQVEAMRNAGVKEIIIVIGATGEKIKKHFGSGARFGVKISYVFDKNPQGIASSLLLTKNLVRGPFVLFLGDIFIPKMEFSQSIELFNKYHADGLIIAKRERNLEKVKRNFAIYVNRSNRVLNVEEKPKRPRSNLKGYGLYLFNKKTLQGHNLYVVAHHYTSFYICAFQKILFYGFRIKSLINTTRDH